MGRVPFARGSSVRSAQSFDLFGRYNGAIFWQDNYYYLVIDPSWVNVGVGIAPVDRAPVSIIHYFS
jgi:hypothetical protein